LTEEIFELRGHPVNVANDNGQHLSPRFGLHMWEPLLFAATSTDIGENSVAPHEPRNARGATRRL
jgi:hypothetical protein